MKTKQWRVYYRNAGAKTGTSKGFETWQQATDFMGETIKSGGGLDDILCDGKVLSAKRTFRLLYESGLKIVPR